MTDNRDLLQGNVIEQRDEDRVNPAQNPNGVENESHNPFGNRLRQQSQCLGNQEIIVPQEIPMNREFLLTVPSQSNSSFGNAILISRDKVNQDHSFRTLFVVLLVIIAGSTQGVHSIFGTLLMDAIYKYDVRKMVVVYVTGQAFGMFVFPFGLLYDWFGPRPTILICTILMCLGNLLFALMFGGHINHSVTKSAIFYAIMSWGCYGTQVTVIPCALGYMPRNRGQPLGFLVTFSNLGSSLFACFFRGFFPNHFDRLMWFMFAFCVVAGLLAVWYVGDVSYATTKWERSRLTTRQKVDRYLIRNRYLSVLVPKRRFIYFTLCLIVLNIYLTVQAIVAGYHRSEMKTRDYRGIAIGAAVVVFFTSVLVWPLRCMDEDLIQDREFIRVAKAKEAGIKKRHNNHESQSTTPEEVEEQHDHEGAIELIEAEFDDSTSALVHTALNPLDEPSGSALPHPNEELHPAGETVAVSRLEGVALTEVSQTNSVARSNNHANDQQHHEDGTHPLMLESRELSSYEKPYFEMLDIGHEGFVAPLYEVSFWESLGHLDTWLMFYTTFVMWGIGMTMTGNWNIKIMVAARDKKMDYSEYILFASLSGISTAAGRVFVGTYEVIMTKLHARYGYAIVPTWPYPVASVGLFIGMILWIALPGNHSLIIAYIVSPYFYGMSHSMTFYIISAVYDRDIGMRYGFSFLAAAIGIFVFYYLSWFLPYRHHAIHIPQLGDICVGQRKCMNTAVAIYIVFSFSSIFTSFLVHWRCKKLIEKRNSKRE